MELLVHNASHATTELGPALVETLQKFCRCRLVHNLDEEGLYIIICPAGLPYPPNRPYIAYQLESTINGPAFTISKYGQILRQATVMWDYTLYNIKQLAGKIPQPMFYLPIGWAPSLEMENVQYDESVKDIDVLFLGWTDPYPRRYQLRDRLASKYQVLFTSSLNYVEMLKVIARAKICLNVHVADNFLLETVRLSMLLSNKSCIISETAENRELEQVYQNHLYFVSYQEIEEKIAELLAQPQLRKSCAEAAYHWYRTERSWDKLVNWPTLLRESIEFLGNSNEKYKCMNLFSDNKKE